MTNDGLCPICRLEDESLYHRFRDCSASLATWNCFSIRNQGQFFCSSNWKEWLKTNLCGKPYRCEEPNWSILFGVTLDLMWRNRNDHIFSQKTHNTHSSIMKIRHQVEGIMDCMMRKSTLNPQFRSFIEAAEDNCTPPPLNYLKLNCDGSIRDNGRSEGCGGVLRDEHGDFILAFTQRLQACSSLEVELWGILHGLQIAWSKNLKSIVVETDSLDALELIAGGHQEAAHIQRLVVDIIEVGGGELNVTWRKVNRLNNCVANKLAKLSHTVYGNIIIFDFIPDFLVNSLAFDNIGLAGARLH